MATDARVRRPATRGATARRLALPDWPAPAWGAIGVTALFIAITGWWLSQDRSIPVFDAGLHLSLAVIVHRELAAGHLLNALTLTAPYPPFPYLIGSLGILVGGLGVTAPILAENLVFVSLLALGCYKVARIAFGPTAGLLAVVFALGSPLLTAQFHVFMLDAPETAMVAVSVWLILASDGFSRLGTCAIAGLAVGLGMLTKEPFAIFVVGVVGVTLWRGGRRSWRGFLLFAAVAIAVAMPWYLHELGKIQTIGSEVSSSAGSYATYGIPEVAPPRLSPTNLEWYFWNILNAQLYLPLLVLAAAGWVWTLAGLIRRRATSRLAVELVIGSFLGWALLTETFIHDTRYSLPLLVYLAVFAAGGIVRLGGRRRILATTVLVLVALANTLGSTFGVGGQVKVVLPGATANTLQQPGTVTIFQDSGFLVSAPRRDGDLLGMLQALRRNGVQGVIWPSEAAEDPAFSEGGLHALILIAGLKALRVDTPQAGLSRTDAVLIHGPVAAHGPAPCLTLDDGSGVWVRLGSPASAGGKRYCPLPQPRLYG